MSSTSSESSPGRSGKGAEASALESLARRQVAALNRRDLDALIDLYADDAVLEFPASAPISGKDAIRRSYERFFREWEEAVEIKQMVSSGDVVAAEGLVEGRHRTIHTKISGRVALPQRPYRHAFAAFWQFREGKISRHRVYYDARELVRQILGS